MEISNGDPETKKTKNFNENENVNIFQKMLEKTKRNLKLKNLAIQKKIRNESKILENIFDEIVFENRTYKIPQGYPLKCVSNIELALMNHRINIEHKYKNSQVNHNYYFPKNVMIQEYILNQEIPENEKCVLLYS